MSDLLNLATDLKARDDAQLVRLLEGRGHVGSPKDFFDLAQALINPKSIMASLCTLTVGEVRALSHLASLNTAHPGIDAVAATQIPGPWIEALHARGLAYKTASGVRALDSVIELATPLIASLRLSGPEHPTEPLLAEDVNPSELGQAAIAAFQTQQGVYELLLDAEANQLKHTGKTGFGVSDVKRMAAHLNLDNGQVRALYRLAAQLNLLQLIGETWWFTPAARSFVASSILDRWRALSKQWLASLGPLGAPALAAELTQHGHSSLIEALLQTFPLRDEALLEQIKELAAQAEALGLSIDGKPSALLTNCLVGGLDLACDMLARHLPGLQHSLIVQADLSLIAPGPLDGATEATLRMFANVEQVSVANTYRLSAQSISRGLECGLSIDGIRSALLELNSRQLPQPVEYLLTDTANKFAQLRITAGPGGSEKSVLTASDALLLTQVLNDSRLRPFAFQATTASSISTRFDPDVVYQSLREQGYLPVIVDSSGAVVSPRRLLAVSALADSGANPLQVLINNLREADRRVGNQPDDQDITRQVQLAIKSKVTLLVYATDRSGKEVEFKLLPTALANGRLRGMDWRSDVERTLPLERIARVELG
ncbi:MAG: helicase-associated domain-containing protein [Micrococcales bacterium]